MDEPALGAPAGSRGPQLARIVIAVAIGVWLAWTAVRVQLAAGAVARGQPATGLVLNPASAAAASALATQALVRGDTGTARAAALRAVAIAPLDAASVRTLGLLDSRDGDEAGARRWMSLGGALGWREPGVQLWLTDRLLAAGLYDQAVPRIDAMLRLQLPANQLARLLNRLAALPVARPAIVTTLASRPPWRADYLSDMAALNPDEVAGREALIALLRAAHAPMSRAELRPLIVRLADAHDDRRAYDLWLRNVAERRLLAPSGLYDGGFDAKTDDLYFPYDWSIYGDAASVASIDADGAGGRSLHIFAADTIPALLTRQQLLLAPGDYELLARSTGGAGTDRLDWGVLCSADNTAVPTSRVTNAAPGMFGIRFRVPEARCAVQAIELHGEAPPPGETIDTRIDAVTLRRI